jgi:hypothetical protein
MNKGIPCIVRVTVHDHLLQLVYTITAVNVTITVLWLAQTITYNITSNAYYHLQYYGSGGLSQYCG